MKAYILGLAVSVGLALAGCGGGSGGGGGASEVTRALLDGGGATSGAGVTTKTWRLVAIAGNHNYPSTGSDQACPVTLESTVDDTQTLRCGASDTVTISSDGTFKFNGFGKTWSLDGSQMMLDFGTALGTEVAEVVPETVGGVQRVRVLQVSFTKKGTRQTHDDGSVLVLEEAAM